MHLIEIPLILLRGGCSKADRIPEIIGCQSRHNCIQVNDAQPPARILIKQNIIQLRVIVRHPERKLPFLKLLHQHAAVLLPRKGKLNLRTA